MVVATGSAEELIAFQKVGQALIDYAATVRRWVICGDGSEAMEAAERQVMARVSEYGTARAETAVGGRRRRQPQVGPPEPLITRDGRGPDDAA